ncbi:hypothetical protein SK803_26720 [Lentzea sp. BCCO 10_0856]|uniref:HPr Serine kinase C-terminal domain-containing protein n=1 Tax=Lentzea miocenica TaxID=3095431 RepID=A0ABU4T6P9_9PSEU|nr:hypothetical protein [Lentzea sp. BCCO 10_0856]MDX8033831.1 hypothetical protein [Lentzea sp. BCCO 10_0856]
MLTEVLVSPPLGDVTLALRGPANAVRRLTDFAAPFLVERQHPVGPLWTIELRETLPADARLTGEPPEPAHHMTCSGRHVVIACDRPEWMPVLVTRYVRTLTRAMAVANGAIPLHGAAIEVGGTGVLLVGRKWAGKTTASLSLVRCGDGALVSNDDVLLVATDNRWDAVGGPRAVGIRTDSLAQHRPVLTAEALAGAATRHPATREDKAFLLVAEVPALGGRVASRARADVVIELCSDPELTTPVAERLDGDEIRALLAEHLETGADRRRHGFLAAVGAPVPELSEHAVGSLATRLRYHRYTHPVRDWVDSFLDFVRSEIHHEVITT